MAEVKMAKVKCNECGEEWLPRVATPKKCPSCQSRRWDEKPIRRRVLAGAYKVKKRK